MKRRRAFVTCASRPDVTADDGFVARALGSGADVRGVRWDSAEVLELIEPQLFLDSDPGALARFAGAIRRRLSVGGPLGIQ